MKSICFYFICAFGIISKNLLPDSRSSRFTPMFSLKSFVVAALIFK